MVSAVVKKLNNALLSVGYVLEPFSLKGSRALERWVLAEASAGKTWEDLSALAAQGRGRCYRKDNRKDIFQA